MTDWTGFYGLLPVAGLRWQATDRLSVTLSGETRTDRYRGLHVLTGEELFFKGYTVVNLGAAYELTGWLRLNARVNNLLDRDFTSYEYSFLDNGGSWTLSAQDDYNNKDKARNIWVSLNFSF